MADPTTINRGLAIPTHGSDVDSWDVPLNGNFSKIDQLFGAVLAVATTGGQTDLTLDQCDNGIIRVSGTLTSDALLRFPNISAYFIVENLTTGNFVLRFSSLVGAGRFVGIEQGASVTIYCDGTNVNFVDLPPVGTYLDVCDAAVPAWIAACSVPPYLNCNGGTFSAVTYPYLNAKLGGNTLPDFKGRGNFYLNQGSGRLTAAGAGIDGDTRFSSGGFNGVQLAVNQVPAGVPSSGSASLSVSTTTDNWVAGNASDSTPINVGGSGSGLAVSVNNSPIVSKQPSHGSATGSVSISSVNPSQQIVKSTTPGVVSGIRLIRAA